MKAISKIIALLAVALVSVASTQAKELFNRNDAKVGLNGYDPVSFFQAEGPQQGHPARTAAAPSGTVYYFSSDENRAQFQKDPTKYEPIFNGYCAYGASINLAVPVSAAPGAWRIMDGRLVMCYNAGLMDEFLKDKDGNFKKANANWPGIVEKSGRGK